MLVIKFAVLVERCQIFVFKISIYAAVPNLSTHRDTPIIKRRFYRSWVWNLVPINGLHGFVIDKVLVILRDDLVNRRWRSPAEILRIILLSISVGRNVRIILASVAHSCNSRIFSDRFYFKLLPLTVKICI